MANAKVSTSSGPIPTAPRAAGSRTAHVESHWVGQRQGRLANLVSYLGLLFLVLLIGLPVYWMIIGSFKATTEIYRIPPTWLPTEPTVTNFIRAWNSAPFGRCFCPILITTLFGSSFEIFFAVTTAYAFAFLRFPKKSGSFCCSWLP